MNLYLFILIKNDYGLDQFSNKNAIKKQKY